MKFAKELSKIIKEGGAIALLPHDNPDGDALGSALAFKELAKELGVQADIYVDEIPKNLQWLEGEFIVFKEEAEIPKARTAVALDCGGKNMLGKRAGIFDEAENRIVIDHHASNEGYGDLCLVLSEASAACEIIYELFCQMGVSISPLAASHIYTGILTDTGGFRYSNTTAKTHETAAELIRRGADTQRLCREVFENKSIQELAIEAAAFESAEFFHQGRTVITYITNDMMKKTGAASGDMSNISGILRGIKGVAVAVTLKDGDKGIKISMRSKGAVDVSAICGEFGGGGHKRAAGALADIPADEIIKKLTALIGEAYERCD